MWGKPDALDRLAQVLVALTALVALGNGLFMLAAPFGWYEWLGTVKATGPANGHFIRDIGLAYLTCVVLLGYGALNLPLRWGAALAGATWLLLHGMLHVWEVSKGLCSPDIFWAEAPGTLGPPLIALAGIALHMARMRISSAPLPKALFLRLADTMTHGLSPYFKDLGAAPGFLTEKYQHFMALSQHRHAAPLDLIYMVRFGALRGQDCGPCSLICAHGALREGLPRPLVEAALRGELGDPDQARAFAFGRAVAEGTAEADALGEAIEADLGRAVRTELAVAAASCGVFPSIKRGLGYAKSCAATPLVL
ncbi:MAG: hypothetical protein ACKOQ3_12095 [Novosphingobium sp.]